jgi:hypothetical protein
MCVVNAHVGKTGQRSLQHGRGIRGGGEDRRGSDRISAGGGVLRFLQQKPELAFARLFLILFFENPIRYTHAEPRALIACSLPTARQGCPEDRQTACLPNETSMRLRVPWGSSTRRRRCFFWAANESTRAGFAKVLSWFEAVCRTWVCIERGVSDQVTRDSVEQRQVACPARRGGVGGGWR